MLLAAHTHGGAAQTLDDQLTFDLGIPPPERREPTLPAPPRPAAPPPRPSPPHIAARPAPPRPQKPPKPQPFHYTNAMWDVVRDIVATLPEFQHVDLNRVLLSISQARQSSKHGTYAFCFPMRFEGGAEETVQRGHRFRMRPIVQNGHDLLYLLYFVLPRFHEEQDYHEKLATIIHELYHISPLFNGDIRRFPGKNFAHGHSREVYHAAMRKLADKYLATSPLADTHEFLRTPFNELLNRPGGVVGACITRPKPYLVEAVAPHSGGRRK